MARTRRSLLRRAVATLSGATGGSVAGCSAFRRSGAAGRVRRTPYEVPDRTRTTATETTHPELIENVDFGRVSVPEPGEPDYRRWLPAPGELPEVDLGGSSSYRVLVVDRQQVRDLGASVPDAFDAHRQMGRHRLDYFGIGAERYRRVIQLGYRAAVVEAAVDRSVVAQTLTGTGYRPAGEYRGYRLFDRDDGPRAVAVGDTALVFSNGTGGIDPADVVRTVLDADARALPRYHESRTSTNRLIGATGGPPLALLSDRPWERPAQGHASAVARSPPSANEFDDLAGFATAFGFDRARTYWRFVFAFETPVDPGATRDALREFAAYTPRVREASSVSVAVGSRQGSVVAAVEDDRYASVFGPAAAVAPPQVTWSYEQRTHDEGVTVTLTHEAGDEVARNALQVEGGDFVDGRADADPIGPGESLAVAVPTQTGHPPDRIRVVWRAPDRSAVLPIASYPLA